MSIIVMKDLHLGKIMISAVYNMDKVGINLYFMTTIHKKCFSKSLNKLHCINSF